jgi:transcriptional regulator with XRE-family HTH domain
VTWIDFDWTKRVAWDTFEIERAEPMVKVGMHFIGELVRHRRHRLKISQADLGFAVGVHQSVISRLENGRLRGMRFAKFARLVAVLGGLDPQGPVPHWVILRRGWHHDRDIAVDDPRWFSPEGVGRALERGLFVLSGISGIGHQRPRDQE